MRKMINLHPSSTILFYICVIFYSMYTTNLYIMIISFLSAILFLMLLQGFKRSIKYIIMMLLLIILISITNQMFTHQGSTILFKIGKLNYTYEALIYGLYMGLMISSILTWFMTYNIVISNDKFIYLFGGLFPNIAISISMGLSYLPRLRKQSNKIINAQKNLGFYSSSLKDKIKISLRAFSILTTYSLENSLDLADSMNARGFGVKKRTRFSIYKYTFGDVIFTSLMVLLASYIIYYSLSIKNKFVYYPVITKVVYNLHEILIYIVVAILMLIPSIIEAKENLKWKYLK